MRQNGGFERYVLMCAVVDNKSNFIPKFWKLSLVRSVTNTLAIKIIIRRVYASCITYILDVRITFIALDYFQSDVILMY